MKEPIKLAVILAAALALAFCSSNGTKNQRHSDDDDDTPKEDASQTDDDDNQDAATSDDDDKTDNDDDDNLPQLDCEEAIIPQEIIELDLKSLDCQIHVTARFDGSGIWLVYNLPSPSGLFDVYAIRLNCDGSPSLAPFKVSTTDYNNIDPDLAVGKENIFIVWQSDNSSGLRNLDIYYRIYAKDGTPLMERDKKLAPSRNGSPADYNAWMAKAAHLGADAFAITGSWALEEAERFQTFIQRVDADGELIGEAIDAHFHKGMGQIYPDIAASGDLIYIAWTNQSDEGEERAVFTKLAPEANETSPKPPLEAVEGRDGSQVSLSASKSEERVYLAFNSESSGDIDIILRDAADKSPNAPYAKFGQLTKTDHTPNVAAGEKGGAVVWFRNIQGIKNDVMIQRFTYGEGNLEKAGNSIQANEEPAAPYPPAITHIFDNIYFAAWSEGKSPDFRMKGRFIRLD